MVKLPITVVIPCYQQEQWVNYAIHSAKSQVYNVDVFDINPKDWRVGVCYARNYLINHITNGLILCLDADDRLLPDGLERLYAAYKPGTWTYGGWQEIDENEAILGDYEAPPPGTLSRKNVCYASFLFSKDDWRAVGGFDPDFELGAEDWAFQVALTNAGIKPVRIEGQVIQRMIHPTNSRTERAKKYFPMLKELLKEKYPSVMNT